MASPRKTATRVGVLFLTAMGASVLGGSIVDSFLGADDYLSSAYDNNNWVVVGVLLELVNCSAVVGIAVLMYPILRKRSEAMALGYVGFRVIESTVLAIAAVIPLAILKLSSEYSGTEAVDSVSLQSLGTALIAVRENVYGLMLACFFSLGAFLFYYLLYQTELIPRFLSVWGLIGVAGVLALNVFEAFSGSTGVSAAMVLAVPIITNEIVLGIWLIAKGFNGAAISRLLASGDVAAVRA